MSSQQLKDKYPFLWLNIMSIAAATPKRKAALGIQAKDTIIQKVVVERDISLDLLLGLLVFSGW